MRISEKSRSTGVGLVALSALFFSSAGIFTNSVSTDAWGVIFWRGLAAGFFTVVYMCVCGMVARELKAFGRSELLVSLLMAAGTAAFIPAFKLSSVADVALIYASAPLVAAGLSWIFLSEYPSIRTAIASVSAFVGVVLIVSNSMATGVLRGNLLALFMTLMMASLMVVYRKYPDTTVALPAALSSVWLLPMAAIVGSPLSAHPAEIPTLIAFGLVFAVASVTLSEGARRLPSTDTALLSLLETPLAPMLAFLILQELPSRRLIVGGCVIVLAVVFSQSGTRQRCK